MSPRREQKEHVGLRRDPERLEKLRIAVRYLLSNGSLARGHQTRLAEHFSLSRQRVHQVVEEERLRKLQAAVRYLLRGDSLTDKHQARLAELFSVSPQRVHQMVQEEQRCRERALAARALTLRSSLAASGGSTQIS